MLPDPSVSNTSYFKISGVKFVVSASDKEISTIPLALFVYATVKPAYFVVRGSSYTCAATVKPVRFIADPVESLKVKRKGKSALR